jgi:hypothetical protein
MPDGQVLYAANGISFLMRQTDGKPSTRCAN